MNTIVTSREAILAASRKLVIEQGIDSVNMRTVATACGVAVGSVYNYFPSKADLLTATVKEVWQDIFHDSNQQHLSWSFIDNVAYLFTNIQKGCREYPGFFTLHAVSFAAEEKEKGRKMMEQYFEHIKYNMLDVLNKDSKVRNDAFDESLSPSQLVDLVFSLLVSLLLLGNDDCSPLLEMIRRSIY